MRMFKLAAAVALLMSTAACAVYTRDYVGGGYYAYGPADFGPPEAQSYAYTAP